MRARILHTVINVGPTDSSQTFIFSSNLGYAITRIKSSENRIEKEGQDIKSEREL